jgi:uncharacterized phage infection (PIP) family protein YhgE
MESKPKPTYCDDPIVLERPFFVRNNSARIADSSSYEKNDYQRISREVEEKKENFPWLAMTIYCFFISLFALCFGALYIGGVWNPGKKLVGLNYVVVNDDKGCYTSLCEKIGLNNTRNVGNYYARLDGTGGRFTVVKGTRNDAIEYVKKFKYWAAFYIPEKFTVDVISNLNVVNKHGHVDVKVEVILDEARSYNTISLVRKALRRLQNSFHIALVRSFQQLGSFNPPFLINGISYTETSLHTVEKYGQNFASFVTLMLVWISTISASIITHFYFAFEIHWLEKKEVHHPYIKIISSKILTNCLMVLFTTFIIILIQCICGNLTMEKGYIYYYLFVFYYALCGIAVNCSLIHVLPFIAYYLVAVIFMMLQITTCGGIFDHSVQFGFWKIGRALPMYYATRQLKNIFWGVGEHTKLANVLIILAWIVVSTIVTIYLYILELKTKRENWLRREYRKLLNYKNESTSFYNRNDDMTPLKSREVPMESMEDFDFTEKEYNRRTSITQ